jgi:cation diffusion facilitator family transporter
VVAAAINLSVARLLMRTGRDHGSVAIDSDGRHLMTDVVTSIGVVLGLTLARVTGIDELDPIIALLVAVNVVWTAISLLRTGIDGLMDRALPDADVELVRKAIERQMSAEDTFHALRTRRAGSRQFVDFHLLVPGQLTVQGAHELTERIESAVSDVLPNAQTTVHIEPIEDPLAYDVEEIAPFEEEDLPAPAPSTSHRPIAHAR